MCDRSFPQRRQWKWKSRSLVSHFILITPGLLVFVASFITGSIYEGLSPVIMLVIETAGCDVVQCLQPYSRAQLPASESRLLFLSSPAVLRHPNTGASIVSSQPAHKYAIMVRLLSSLLGWLEWRLRLSWLSNVGLMVLTCTGHRWSPEQP